MSLPDPEIISRVAAWRAAELSGTMTDEERIKATIWLREKRRTAATASTSEGSSKKRARSAEDLLGELGI